MRVDVVERLAGIIRSALADEPPGVGQERPAHRSPKGFVVTGEMTSLTGCSGEPFASILRSMEFRPVEVKRSEFFASSLPDKELAQAEAPALVEDPAPAIDPVLASPEEPLTDGAGSEDLIPSLAPTDPSESLAADVGAQPASPQTSGLSGESAKNDDMIVVWRPERRRPPFTRGGREGGQARNGRPPPDSEGRQPVSMPKRSPKAAMRPPVSENRPNSTRPDEKRRQRASDYDMPRSLQQRRRSIKAKVDPNSPFAKLLELRSLLEGQANKRLSCAAATVGIDSETCRQIVRKSLGRRAQIPSRAR